MNKRRIKVETTESSLQMTSMIDVVFLLLAFFVITYKTPEVEGDFNIRMPANAQSTAAPDLDDVMPVTVKMTADPDGKLTSITFGDARMKDMKELRSSVYRYVIQNDVSFQDALNAAAKPEFRDDVEMELDCDPQLKYSYAMEAITAVTGYLNAEDQTIKMVEKVKFSPKK